MKMTAGVGHGQKTNALSTWKNTLEQTGLATKGSGGKLEEWIPNIRSSICATLAEVQSSPHASPPTTQVFDTTLWRPEQYRCIICTVHYVRVKETISPGFCFSIRKERFFGSCAPGVIMYVHKYSGTVCAGQNFIPSVTIIGCWGCNGSRSVQRLCDEYLVVCAIKRCTCACSSHG